MSSFFNGDDLPTSSRGKLIPILNDPPTRRKHKMELAITVDSMTPFVRVTYNLEGDGMLALTAYQEISQLQSTIICSHYPNVDAIAREEGRGNATHERHLAKYANNCVQPVYEYFQAKFDAESGELKTAALALKAPRYFSPIRFSELKPTSTDIDSLNIFPFIDAALLDQLKQELPIYLAAAEGISSDVQVMDWWKIHENEISTWSTACKHILLVQPSSAAAERVFSLLQNSFTKRQQSSLDDYISLSVMLQYNC